MKFTMPHSFATALFLGFSLLTVSQQVAQAQNDPVLDRVSSSPIPDPNNRKGENREAGKDRVLVEGSEGIPALTQEMTDRLTLMFEWLLDSPTTEGQRAQLTEWVVTAWKTQNTEDIQSALKLIDAQRVFEQKPEVERELIRQQISAKLLELVRQKPDEPANRWLLSVYAAAHKPLAPGDPPLTRQMTDAWCEVLCFLRNKIAGDEQLQATQAFKETMARDLAKEYRTYSESWHKHLAGMPLTWAAIRAEWPHLNAEQRDKKKEAWRAYLKQVFPELLTWKPKPPAGNGAGVRPGETYAQAMARLQRQHETFMFMSNMMTMRHVGMMNGIANIGNSGYHYEYRYVP